MLFHSKKIFFSKFAAEQVQLKSTIHNISIDIFIVVELLLFFQRKLSAKFIVLRFITVIVFFDFAVEQREVVWSSAIIIIICILGLFANVFVVFVILVLKEHKKAATHWYELPLK